MTDAEPRSEIAELTAAIRLLADAVTAKTLRPNPESILTTQEAAAMLRVSVETVRQLAVIQRLPCQFLEGDWRFLAGAVTGWLAEAPKPGACQCAGPRAESTRPVPVSPYVRHDDSDREAEEFLARLEKLREADDSDRP